MAAKREHIIGGASWEFVGDNESAFAYAELTGGGLEDAFDKIKPLLRAREIPGEMATFAVEAMRARARVAEVDGLIHTIGEAIHGDKDQLPLLHQEREMLVAAYGQTEEESAEKLMAMEQELIALSKTMNDPRPWLELAYAFSAGYRDRHGWDSVHFRIGDPSKHPLDRGSFKAFLRATSPCELREVLKGKILSLYSESLVPPMTTGIEKGTSAAPVSGEVAENPSVLTGEDSIS